MSTTVKYKGNTLTTVLSNTKTLKTAGKYMEDDVILVDDTVDGDSLGYGDASVPLVNIAQADVAVLNE